LYDPLLARFLAPDPLVGSGLTNEFNRFIYCRNNPLMFTDPSGESPFFEIGWGSDKGFFYRESNENSGFYGNFNYNTGVFTAGSTYYGYQSTQNFSQRTYSTSFLNYSQSYKNFGVVGINSGTIENENGELTFDLHYQLHEVSVSAIKSYKKSIGYPVFGELLSGKVDDRGYGPWNPDAIQLELGGTIDLIGLVKYSGGIGLISSGSHTNLYFNGSGGLFLSPSNLSNLSSLSLLKFSPYISINLLENLTINHQSLNAYQSGGVTSALELGPVSFNYAQSADTEKAFMAGPFAPTTNDYNSYGISLSIGGGISYSRIPTYTYFIFK